MEDISDIDVEVFSKKYFYLRVSSESLNDSYLI